MNKYDLPELVAQVHLQLRGIVGYSVIIALPLRLPLQKVLQQWGLKLFDTVLWLQMVVWGIQSDRFQ